MPASTNGVDGLVGGFTDESASVVAPKLST
jgi:hypothetical protein